MSAERLYYDQPYLRRFEARVTSSGPRQDKYAVNLDKTAFYPTSGGQPNDLGTIGDAAVVDVLEEDHEVVHITDRAPSREAVECNVDWTRRFDMMQQHTGQHILSAAFEKICDADTVGFHLTEHSLTIDLNMGALEAGVLRQVEEMANQVVFESRCVSSVWPDDAGLRGMPLRKPPARAEGIRVVVVEGLDYSPCGGTHVSSTGQVGIVKVLGWEKVRSGIRIPFACGWRALKDYGQKNETVAEISAILSAPGAELDRAVRRLVEQNLAYGKRIESMGKELVEYEAQSLARTGGDVVARCYASKELPHLRLLASLIASCGGRVAVLGSEAPSPQVIVARSDDVNVDARQLIEVAKSVLGGKGGGNPKLAQAGCQDASLIAPAVQAAGKAARDAIQAGRGVG